MYHSQNRTIEKVTVGLYLFVLCGALALLGLVQVSSGPYIGGAFLVIGGFWLTVVAGISASLVVLAVNGWKIRNRRNGDRWAVSFAALVLLTYGSGIYLAFVTTHVGVSMVVGGLGFLSSLGVIGAVFQGRVRRRLGR